MAVWLNLTTALVDSRAPITTPAAIVGQIAILAGSAPLGGIGVSRGLLINSLVPGPDGTLRLYAAAGEQPSESRT